jgi:2-polyprenyl-3-methyl-5-hydroxy-6-metoxy-1,4-benzoquinol methylase
VALSIARKHVPEANFYQAIPPGGWDVITIMGVAEHFEKPQDELRYIGTFLNPGGYLYLEVPNCLSYSPDRTEGFRKTFAGADQIEWHLSRASWNQIIKDAGFTVVKDYKSPDPAWEFIWILSCP